MKDLEQARVLLAMARKDVTALRAMGDPLAFAEEIFGFHAQQAVEKALKAWIAALGGEYPYRHDLGELISVLQRRGVDVEGLWDLVEYTDYGVRLRYESLDDEEPPLDREAVIRRIAILVTQVGKVTDGLG